MAENLKILVETVTSGTEKLQAVASGIKEMQASLNLVGIATAAFSDQLQSLGDFAQQTLQTLISMEDGARKMAAALGISKEKADEFSGVAKDLFARKNLGDDMAQATDAVTQAFQLLGDVGDDALSRVADAALRLQKTFGVDTEESISSVKTLMDEFGLTSKQAFDFVAKGFQQGLNRGGDFLESVEEYSVQFKEAGFSAEQFYSAIRTGAAGGVLGTDKIADSIKEFRVRIQDGSKATREGLTAIGIDANKLLADLASGAKSPAAAFAQVTDALRNTSDKTVQFQAGVALLGSQFEDLGADAVLGVNLAASSMADLNGAIESISYETIGEQLRGMWRGFLDGVLEAIKMIAGIVSKFTELDGVSKALALTLGGYAAVFLIWNAGAEAMVINAIAMATSFGTMAAAARAAIIDIEAASIAIKTLAGIGVVSIAFLFTIPKVSEAIDAFNSMRDAQREAAIGWAGYRGEMDATLDTYSTFKNLPQLPADLTKASKDDLASWRDDLQKSKVYYTTLYLSLMETAEERTFFGTLTDEAIKARDQMQGAKDKIDEINRAMSGIDAAGMERPTQAAKASKEAIEEFAKAAQKAYDDATKAAKGYADEAASLEQKLADAKLTGEDKVRAIRRQGMDEEQAAYDTRLQAEEKAAAAAEARLTGNYELAQKLNAQSSSLYEQLAKTDITAAETGVRERSQFEQDLYQERLAQVKDLEKAELEKASKIKTELDTLTAQTEKQITLTVPELDAMKREFEELTKPAEKIVKIKTVEEKNAGGIAGEVPGFAGGGWVRRSGRLPGFGTRDTVPALLTWGERIINAHSTRAWDTAMPGFMAAANRARSVDAVRRMVGNLVSGFRDGGIVDGLRQYAAAALPPVPRLGYASGGVVSGQGFPDVENMGAITINVGGTSAPLMGDREVIAALKRELQREQRRGRNS